MRSRVFTGNASFSVHLSGRLARLPRAITSFFAHLTAVAGRHLRWKIVLPYAFLALVLGCAATYLATGVITSSLSERADNQLIESARVSSDTLARLERKHLETVRAIMFSDGVSAAIEARDSGQLNALVQGTAANSELQYLQVLDASGQRLTAVRLSAAQTLEYSDITDSDTPASWPPVQQAVATASTHGGKATAIVQTAGGPVVYTAGAVQSGERVIGVVLVGTSLQTLVGQMKNESLADVTIYADEGSPSATSFVQPSEASSKEADVSPPLAARSALEKGGVYREQRTIWGRDYNVLYAPLLIQGARIGAYSVALPADYIVDAQDAARWKMALLFGIAMLAVLATGFYISRAITRPVDRLMLAAEQVSAGDFAARANITSHDEIGRLGAAIDRMTETLQGQYVGTLRALASAVANKDPVTLGHSVRVGQLAAMLGRQFQLDERTIAQLEMGGYLHDLAKIGIRDSQRLKLEALTPQQRDLLERHPHLDLLASSSTDTRAHVASFRKPGNYSAPFNEEGTIVARIVEAADLYDAVRLGGAQLGGFTSEQALTFLRTQVGAVISIGMLDALAAVAPDWEQRRANDRMLQRLLVETALDTK
jgi:HAMP domain-containing protein